MDLPNNESPDRTGEQKLYPIRRILAQVKYLNWYENLFICHLLTNSFCLNLIATLVWTIIIQFYEFSSVKYCDYQTNTIDIQVLATTVKNFLLFDMGLCTAFPTIVIPALTGHMIFIMIMIMILFVYKYIQKISVTWISIVS